MNRIDRAAERDPALYPFGTEPKGNPWKLTAKQERKANFETRLRSIWKYVVRRARRFCATLTDRERSQMDAEDLVGEIVASLLEKDAKWNPERGRYVTFAESVMRNVLSLKREHARVVAAPANAAGRLRQYQELYAQGKLSPASTRTMRAIEGALGETETVSPTVDPPFGADREHNGHTTLAATRTMETEVSEALRTLDDPRQCLVLGRTYGLFGGDEQTPKQIADAIGTDSNAVRNLQGRAKNAMRRRIEKLREAKACDSTPGSPTTA